MSGPKLAMIWIDGQPHAVEPGRNLLEVALGLGYDLPYFCWHPALGCVGACRQCAVTQFRDEQDLQGRVVMACMSPCAEGSRFSLQHADAQETRRSVVELLMTNHPHDCPVCEEGGNCHLQDMTVMTGHRERRYRYAKRTHRNQDLGPCVSHEMNRCIACYRCVRFYRDYAGGKDLDVFGAHEQVYFGRAEDGTLESPFSGNLVEVCPTGVFTDKPYGEHYTRKWDLQSAPSICAHCSIGCNVSPGERYNRIRRIENRYHGEINGHFLCDRGRYGHAYAHLENRPVEPSRRGATLTPQSAAEHLEQLLSRGNVIGIGSPRASLEANFALRERVGVENFYRGESAVEVATSLAALDLLREPGVEIASVHSIETADVALVLGEDVLNTGARLALALRQMVRQKSFAAAAAAGVPPWQDASVRILAGEARSPLYVATSVTSDLDGIATASLHAHSERLAAFADQVSCALSGALTEEGASATLARRVATDLLAAKRPALVTGCGSRSVDLLRAGARLAQTLHATTGCKLRVAAVQSEANSVGTSLLGGPSLEPALERMQNGSVSAVIVLENDLVRHAPESKVIPALARVSEVVILDHVATTIAAHATLHLPSTNVFESDGTVVNFEGRAQRHYSVYRPLQGHLRAAWRWLQPGKSATFDDLRRRMIADVPALTALAGMGPTAEFRIEGSRVPRQPHRYSGRTAMHAHLDIHEPRSPIDQDSPLAFSMEGASPMGPTRASLTPVFWAPGWNSGQSLHRFQSELGGSLQGGDPGVRLLSAAARSLVEHPHDSVDVISGAGRQWMPWLPVQRLFGSEELSALSPPLRARATPARAVLHPDLAAQLNLVAGHRLHLRVGDTRRTLELVLNAGLAATGIGLPAELFGSCDADARVLIEAVST